jgi:hypothetical protein
MSGMTADLIARYLDELHAGLRVPAAEAELIAAEAEDHLRETAAAGIAIGMTELEAQEAAISSFGPVRAVVRAHRRRTVTAGPGRPRPRSDRAGHLRRHAGSKDAARPDRAGLRGEARLRRAPGLRPPQRLSGSSCGSWRAAGTGCCCATPSGSTVPNRVRSPHGRWARCWPRSGAATRHPRGKCRSRVPALTGPAGGRPEPIGFLGDPGVREPYPKRSRTQLRRYFACSDIRGHGST